MRRATSATCGRIRPREDAENGWRGTPGRQPATAKPAMAPHDPAPTSPLGCAAAAAATLCGARTCSCSSHCCNGTPPSTHTPTHPTPLHSHLEVTEGVPVHKASRGEGQAACRGGGGRREEGWAQAGVATCGRGPGWGTAAGISLPTDPLTHEPAAPSAYLPPCYTNSHQLSLRATPPPPVPRPGSSTA